MGIQILQFQTSYQLPPSRQSLTRQFPSRHRYIMRPNYQNHMFFSKLDTPMCNLISSWSNLVAMLVTSESQCTQVKRNCWHLSYLVMAPDCLVSCGTPNVATVLYNSSSSEFFWWIWWIWWTAIWFTFEVLLYITVNTHNFHFHYWVLIHVYVI